MTNQFSKYLLLMWKNGILLRRRPIYTAFEIIYPVLICMILIAVRTSLGVEEKGPLSYPPSDVATVENGTFCTDKSAVAYSPSNPFLLQVVTSVINNICGRPFQIIGYTNAEQLNAEIDSNTDLVSALAAAIIFNNGLSGISSSSELTSNVHITLRLPTVKNFNEKAEWFTELLYPELQTPGPRSDGKEVRETHDQYGAEPDYFKRGFLQLQHHLTVALMNNGESVNPGIPIQMNRLSYPRWLDDDLFYIKAMEIMISLLIMMSFMYNYINTISAIATEKEKQLKESMKIMGLPGWCHWMAWFVHNFILLEVAIILIIVVVKVNFGNAPVFAHSDGGVLFSFLLLFACASITFCFFISVFFSKANTATAVGSLIFFLTYLPYSLQQQTNSMPASSALAASLLPNSALCFGISVILKFEAIEEGVQFNNLWSTATPDDDLKLGNIIIMLFLDMFLYLGLALYIEAIFPGEFGVPQRWYYPFTRAYWCKTKVDFSSEVSAQNKREYFEKFTENLPIGIQLQDISKTFGSNKAVKKLNLDMYEGHITVLLGHNGAGKTTTMSMITGMFPPTDGTALVGGYNVRTNIHNARDSMGLCLQHNVLFDELTVYEHLFFSTKLKGLKKKEIKQEVNTYISLLELEDKRHARSSTLSDGMKRKLSIGMALCGKSKVVILDEPTAGMDPSARREIWNILQKQKEGRTILLTTHFMDEADLLGDRIAIMAGGKLQCCGSSFFLKRKYGAGYYLIMDVAPDCQPAAVTDLLKKYIPYVQIYSHVGSELTYQLSEHESSKFEVMLHDLEKNTESLGVHSYGVSLTTLEEVFMKVGADHENESSVMYNKKGSKREKESQITIDTTPTQLQIDYLGGFPLLRNQFFAMVLKKVWTTLRTWYLFVLQVGLPVVLLIITVLNSRGYVPATTFQSMEFSLNAYEGPITLLEGNNQSTYYTLYKNMLKGHQISQVTNIGGNIFQLTTDSPPFVKMHYIIAASFDDNVITAWFNGDPYHSTALSLALVLNTLYKNIFGEDHSIYYHNHPLPLDLSNQLDDLQFNIMGFQIAIELGYGMAFVASFYVFFCVRERISKSKHLQFVSGVNVFIFWGTSFLCDLVTYLITLCGIIITFAALQEDGFKTADELGRITLVLLYFGFYVLPFTYLASYLFGIPATGFSRMMLIGAVAGIIGITAMQVLEIRDLKLLDVAKALNWVLLFLPFYSVAKGAYDLASIYSYRQVCSKLGSLEVACRYNDLCCGIDDYYSMSTPGIGRNIIISFLMSFLLFAILILNEHGFFSILLNKIVNYNKPPLQNVELEHDVKEENNKIKTTHEGILNNTYALVLRDVTKYYKNFLAVNGLCLGVKPYECFGLLGVNGAGKTSTFKMMTGDEQISYGEAWVNGLNIKTEQKKVQKLIGYCPQFDALLDDLTARETLHMFGLIRGVPYRTCKQLGEKLAHEFDFFKHLDKKVKELSGGNKRKLSTSLALIGDPPIIYLDEPTTGMDPATKRFLWTQLAKLRDIGKCIILTSHSMEECEALCTRLAIMVNGTFQCLGSTQRLKNKFAQGYALTIKIRKIPDHANLENEITAIDDFIRNKFPGALLKEKYQELVSYQLINNTIPWSKMFGIMERSKKELNIEDYSLGQCSLEQVFLSFTKHQQ